MARATFRAVLRDLPFKTLVDRVGAVLRLEAPHRLSEIDVPCMYIQGARDRLVHSSHYSDFEGLCGPPVVIDAPHFLLQTKPKDAADQVIGFISDLKQRMGV